MYKYFFPFYIPKPFVFCKDISCYCLFIIATQPNDFGLFVCVCDELFDFYAVWNTD